MTVLLDTNIIMDALQERSPFDACAKEILLLGQNKEIICLITANAVTDIFYLYSKARDVKSARAALDFLLRTYGIVSVTHEDCSAALSLPVDDFEDALVVACARKANADYIITRDDNILLVTSSVKTISPNEFVDLCRNESPKL